MSDTLLRQYAPEECGPDGYPYAWHGRTMPLPHPVATEYDSERGVTRWQAVESGAVYESDEGVTWIGERPGLPDPPREPLPAIKDLIREQAGHRCLRCGHPYPPGIAEIWPGGQWTPCDEHCNHSTRQVALIVPRDVRVEEATAENAVRCAYYRILTVHHLDEDKANCRWWNLAALCQRCHLRMQRAVVMGRPYHYEHSEWFKPFAAGFYAWKYEGADLTREEVNERMHELLQYEHRFTQETL